MFARQACSGEQITAPDESTCIQPLTRLLRVLTQLVNCLLCRRLCGPSATSELRIRSLIVSDMKALPSARQLQLELHMYVDYMSC
jgi:hypothetical protein